MSTKTLRKRIALVAVAALGAGVLSVAPANAAPITAYTDLACGATTTSSIGLTWTAAGGGNAQASVTYSTDGTNYIAVPTTTSGGSGTIVRRSDANEPLADGVAYSITIKALNAGAEVSAASNAVTCMVQTGVLHIGTTPSTTGSATATATYANQRAVGWIAKTSTNGTAHNSGLTLVGGIAGTGVVNAGAKIPFSSMSSTTSADAVSYVVTGGTISDLACSVGTATLNGSATSAACKQASTTATQGSGVLNITAGVGSTATLSAYRGATITGASTATVGALLGQWTFTVAAADASGAFSASNSRIFTQAAMAKGGTASGTNAYDNTARANNGQVNVVYVLLRDAYLAPITSGTLTASVTAGTVNVVDSAGASDSYAATAAFDTISLLGSDGAGYVVVNQPVANTAGSATLTLTLDGAVIGTKTLNWNGDIASIAIDTANTAKTFNNPTTFGSNAASPAAAVKNIVYVAKDAAGNVLELAAHPTIGDQTGSMVGASLSTVDAGASATGDDSSLQTQADGYGVATMLIPSSALRGAGTYQLRITNAVGTTIKSAVQNVTVAGGANTFTASWDKATYAPGDIATLTITAKDSAGNNVGTGVALGSGSLIVTNTDGLSSVTSSCDSANIAATTYTDGVKTCKFAVKNAAGSYSWTAVVATATGQSAAVGTATVSAGTAVSNADVLKAIVSLIASINKQIAALQKALLRR
jgi:trimeric autotransporter adhesin